MDEKLISVLMPVYNTKEDYLRQAIESILNQTYKNFEFIIINDASDEKCVNVIKQYDDKRIILVHNDENMGLALSLNKGITIAKGEYIARMDSDDVAMKERLEVQLTYMESHTKTDIMGTYAYRLGTKKVIKPPFCFNMENRRVKQLFYNAGVLHPTTMIRRSFLEKNQLWYSQEFPRAEDYDMWVRAAQCGKIVNVRKKLLLYRVHENQVTNVYSSRQKKDINNIRLRQIVKIVDDWTEEDYNCFFDFSDVKNVDKKIYDLVSRVLCANKELKIYNQFWLKREMHYIWIRVVIKQILFSKRCSGMKMLYTYNFLRPSYFIYDVINLLM